MNRKTRKPQGLDAPHIRGDAIPVPEATELDGDTAWALWQQEVASEQKGFAPTAPISLPMALRDAAYAKTEPAALHGPKPERGVAARRDKAPSADDLIATARRNNRVCPKPAEWQRFFEVLARAGGPLPAPPLTGKAWARTPDLAKRLCLREHIEFAAQKGLLVEAQVVLEMLTEQQWHHIGDEVSAG